MHRVLGVDILQRGLPTEAMAFVVAVVVAAVTVFRELPLRVLHQIVLLFPPLHVDTIFCPLRSLVQAQVRSNVFSMQHCLLDSDTRATTPSSTSANARTRAGSSIPVRGQASR